MATGQVVPFTPIVTLTIAASTTASAPAIVPGTDSLLVYNATSATAFVVLGSSANTASTPVPPGGRQLFANNSLGNKVSVVLASGSGSVYVTAGNGTAY
jgi:hypothetical protein